MLLEWKDGQVQAIPEVYGIKAFRDIMKADKSKGKEKTHNVFSWLYFMYSPLSEYRYIEDEKERLSAVSRDMGVPEREFNPTALREAVRVYKMLAHSDSMETLNFNMKMVEKIKNFGDNFKFEDIEAEKRPQAAASLTKLAKDLNSLALDIEKTRRAIIAEMDEAGSAVRGGHALSVGDMGMDSRLFEDEFNEPEF